MTAPPVQHCPTCGGFLKVLLLLGVTPDSHLCTYCHTYYAEDLIPLALFVGEEIEDDGPTGEQE